jgi:hypothetical protein
LLIYRLLLLHFRLSGIPHFNSLLIVKRVWWSTILCLEESGKPSEGAIK